LLNEYLESDSFSLLRSTEKKQRTTKSFEVCMDQKSTEKPKTRLKREFYLRNSTRKKRAISKKMLGNTSEKKLGKSASNTIDVTTSNEPVKMPEREISCNSSKSRSSSEEINLSMKISDAFSLQAHKRVKKRDVRNFLENSLLTDIDKVKRKIKKDSKFSARLACSMIKALKNSIENFAFLPLSKDGASTN